MSKYDYLKQTLSTMESNMKRVAEHATQLLTSDAHKVDKQQLNRDIDTLKTQMNSVRDEIKRMTSTDVPTFEKTTVSVSPVRRTLEIRHHRQNGRVLESEKKHGEDKMTLTFERPVQKMVSPDEIKNVAKEYKWMTPAQQQAIIWQMERGEHQMKVRIQAYEPIPKSDEIDPTQYAVGDRVYEVDDIGGWSNI